MSLMLGCCLTKCSVSITCITLDPDEVIHAPFVFLLIHCFGRIADSIQQGDENQRHNTEQDQ